MKAARPEHGLILAMRGRDGEIAKTILAEGGIEGRAVPGIEAFVAALQDGAGFGVMAEEALLSPDSKSLFEALDGQPPWSDFPIILITHRGGLERNADATRQFRSLGNVTFLERPFHPSTLLSLARSALRARRRQYDGRTHIEELDEHRARLAAAIDAAQLGVHEYDPRSGLILWDRFVRRIWGVGEDEPVTYEVFLRGIDPDDRAQVEEAVAAALDPGSGGTYKARFRVRNPLSGVERWVDADGTVTFLDGAPIRLVGTVRDITERKRAEETIRQAESELRVLANAMPQLVWRADAAGRVDYINARYQAYQGFVRDGEWHWQSVVHPDDLDRTKESWSRALAAGASYSCEHRMRNSAGEWRWHMSRAEPATDSSGEVVKWYGTATDIDDLKRAQDGLERLNRTLEDRVTAMLAEKQIFAEIVESTDALVQVSDMAFNFIAINRASANEFEAIFGVRPKVGDNMLDLLAGQPEHREAVRAIWSRALAGEEFIEIDAFGDPRRARRHYEMKFNVLKGHDGRQIGAYQFAYDVTQRLEDQNRLLEAEAKLRQAQKMEAVGQLTGGIAHDFNNLLMVIAAGLRMIERRRDPASEAFIRDAMNQAVERGAGLTRQLLAFSRQRPLEMRALSLARQFQAMQVLLKRALSGDVTIEIDVPDAVWPIETDAGELELAILNLCVNARDAMPQGGVIRIEARNHAGGFGSVTQDAVTIAVSDTGSGMRPEILARVFEPFFTTKEVGKGSGLGLSQVYAFTQQSRGEALIDSHEGRGTTVTLVFPRSAKPATAADAASTSRRDAAVEANAGKVLLVEDDKSVAGLTIALLGSIGYDVEHVTSASSALDSLSNGRPYDIVFSDIMMAGGMSGADLAREIRVRRPRLPVVLATGYVEAGRGIAAEGFQVLQKPYDIEELAAAFAKARAQFPQ